MACTGKLDINMVSTDNQLNLSEQMATRSLQTLPIRGKGPMAKLANIPIEEEYLEKEP